MANSDTPASPSKLNSDNRHLESAENPTQTDEAQQDTPKNKTTSFAELRIQSVMLFKQATRKIQLYTDNLDPRVLNNRQIERIFSEFIRSSRYVRVEILIKAERNLQGIDHRLVKLAQKFATYMEIRIIPNDYHLNHFAFYVVDGRNMLYRTMSQRFEAEWLEVPNRKLKQKNKLFDEVWQISTPASHLRSFII